MIPELQTLYYYEIDHAHLDFDSDPVYQESMARVLAELGTQELSPALFSLLNTAEHCKPDLLYPRLSPWGFTDSMDPAGVSAPF